MTYTGTENEKKEERRGKGSDNRPHTNRSRKEMGAKWLHSAMTDCVGGRESC